VTGVLGKVSQRRVREPEAIHAGSKGTEAKEICMGIVVVWKRFIRSVRGGQAPVQRRGMDQRGVH